MNPKWVAKQTAKAVQNYLTYQAVLIAIDQLSETNPGLAIWLRQHSANNNFQEGETYIEGLLLENKELGLRIMTVREDLAETALEFLVEKVRGNIHQANLEHRRQLLERMTQSAPPTSSPPADPSHPELDLNEPTD
jgi:RbcX protein